MSEKSSRGEILLEKIFDSPTHRLLGQSMDASVLRNKIIADNISNVDTPHFKRREVVFEENLKKVLQSQKNHVTLKTSSPRHIQVPDGEQSVRPEIKVLQDLSYRNDENNVDIDVEMAGMTENKIYYDALAQCMTSEIRLLRMAITGRG